MTKQIDLVRDWAKMELNSNYDKPSKGLTYGVINKELEKQLRLFDYLSQKGLTMTEKDVNRFDELMKHFQDMRNKSITQ